MAEVGRVLCDMGSVQYINKVDMNAPLSPPPAASPGGMFRVTGIHSRQTARPLNGGTGQLRQTILSPCDTNMDGQADSLPDVAVPWGMTQKVKEQIVL